MFGPIIVPFFEISQTTNLDTPISTIAFAKSVASIPAFMLLPFITTSLSKISREITTFVGPYFSNTLLNSERFSTANVFIASRQIPVCIISSASSRFLMPPTGITTDEQISSTILKLIFD